MKATTINTAMEQEIALLHGQLTLTRQDSFLPSGHVYDLDIGSNSDTVTPSTFAAQFDRFLGSLVDIFWFLLLILNNKHYNYIIL